jgi:transposase
VHPRKPYPTDVSDDEWAFVAPSLTAMTSEAPQRRYGLREVFNALRWSEGRADDPTAIILDGRTIQSTPESGARAGYDEYKRRKGSKIHLAVNPLGHRLALHVTTANADERDQVAILAEAVQDATGQDVELAFVDQGGTGERPAAAAHAHSIHLEVVKLPEAKRGFVLLPRRWVVERSFAWASRFRRLARDCERLPRTVAGLHFLAFACLRLHRLIAVVAQSP